MGKKGGATNKIATGGSSPDDADDAADCLSMLSFDDRRLASSLGIRSFEELEQEKARIWQKGQIAESDQRSQMWQNEQRRQSEKQAQKKTREHDREDHRWQQRVAQVLEQALTEGVVESEDWNDGKWWAKVGDDYKSVQDQYFCTLCNKHLNDVTLEHHIGSESHKKKVAWTQCQDGFAGSAGSLSAASTSASSSRPPPNSGERRYDPPELPYLAYVPAEDSNGERWLRCLLCEKWVGDESSHFGTFQCPGGSKEHQKNLRNYGPGNPWYDESVIGDRLKWHPGSLSRRDVEPMTADTYEACWATPECGGQVAVQKATVHLPPGWEVGEAAGYPGHKYYFNRTTGESSWTIPM